MASSNVQSSSGLTEGLQFNTNFFALKLLALGDFLFLRAMMSSFEGECEILLLTASLSRYPSRGLAPYLLGRPGESRTSAQPGLYHYQSKSTARIGQESGSFPLETGKCMLQLRRLYGEHLSFERDSLVPCALEPALRSELITVAGACSLLHEFDQRMEMESRL
jgi:hypothetical protein